MQPSLWLTGHDTVPLQRTRPRQCDSPAALHVALYTDASHVALYVSSRMGHRDDVGHTMLVSPAACQGAKVTWGAVSVKAGWSAGVCMQC